MRRHLPGIFVGFLAACGGRGPAQVTPLAFNLPDSSVVLEGATGASVGAGALLRRAAAADLVLLGELHDNGWHHDVRGRLITALAARHPAIVFEQFQERGEPIPLPETTEALESWLDRYGFDRKGWRWPLHRPVVEAAISHGRSLWGSGLSREALRAVVQGGEAAASEPLRALMERTPLDSAARAAIDQELVEGHCGQLPATMIPGMRAAQVARDAAMTRALLLAGATGPAWLIAGNGHVRGDMGVPRLLRSAAGGRAVLVVGLLERDSTGALPDAVERSRYDLVIVTPAADREDPCAGLRREAGTRP